MIFLDVELKNRFGQSVADEKYFYLCGLKWGTRAFGMESEDSILIKALD